MGLFSRTTAPKKKILLTIDLESGAVAATLSVTGDDKPRIVHTWDEGSFVSSRESGQLLDKTVQHLRETFDSIARFITTTLAGRTGASVPVEVILFFHAPWAQVDARERTTQFNTTLENHARALIRMHFADAPVRRYAASAAAAYAASLHHETHDPLAILLGQEVSEIAFLQGGELHAQGTVPVGYHTFIRTLMQHGGLTAGEASSALRLQHLSEPIGAAATHVANLLGETILPIARSYTPTVLVLLGDAYAVPPLARALASHRVADHLDPGTRVRTITAPQFSAHLQLPKNAEHPSSLLTAETLFAHRMIE